MKPLLLALLIAAACAPALADDDSLPMLITAEQRARIMREFAALTEQRDTLAEKLHNCQTATQAGMGSWW